MSVSLPDQARSLLAYWEMACGDKPVPSGDALDPAVLRRWSSDIVILELHEGEKRLYIKLHGNNVARNIGNYYASGYLEDVVPVDAHDVVLQPYFEAERTHRPVYSLIGAGIFKGLYARFERLILPFVDEASGKTDHFIAWIGPTGRDTVACETIYDPPLVPVNQAHPHPKAAQMVVLA